MYLAGYWQVKFGSLNIGFNEHWVITNLNDQNIHFPGTLDVVKMSASSTLEPGINNYPL